jgi:hypothetical protein
MTKYIPGNPQTIVQNMPGAGSAVAANYFYSAAKPDGLSLVVMNAGLYIDQLLARKEVQFDWSKFAWAGSTTPSESLLYMWAAATYTTIHDVRNATTKPKCGATGTGNTGYYVPKLLEETIGAKFSVVIGIPAAPTLNSPSNAAKCSARHQHTGLFWTRALSHLAAKNDSLASWFKPEQNVSPV